MNRNFTSFVLVLLWVASFVVSVSAQRRPTQMRQPAPEVISTRLPAPAKPQPTLTEQALGNFGLHLPPLPSDLGSGFQIYNGTVLTAVTSMGVFTAHDEAVGAVIPYNGLEASLKFKAGVRQDWKTPGNVVSAELLPMGVNQSAGRREFYTLAAPLSPRPFPKTGGTITLPGLPAGEYMIRAQTYNGSYVYMPLSVREGERMTADGVGVSVRSDR